MTGFAAKGIMSVGNGGSGEQATVPQKRLPMWASRTKGQRAKNEGQDAEQPAAEWRCLSFLERRVGVEVSEQMDAEVEAEEDAEEDDLW